MLCALAFVFFASVMTSWAQDSGYYYQQPPVDSHPSSYAQPMAQQQNTISYRTEYYAFAYPESDYEDALAEQQLSNILQHKVRVVFIKTPENRALEQVALTLAKQSAADKTAIYVLNKQTDAGELAQRLGAIRDQNAQAPMVNFVKYHTAEDAVRAQQQIQAQYDALQGNTLRNSHEGATPVLNFASQRPTIPSATVDTSTAPQTGYYLPASNADDDSFNDAAYDSLVSSSGSHYGFARSNSRLGETYTPRGTGGIVSKINERISKGSKFTFPSSAGPAKTYLPAAHRY